jgi:flagellar basal body rod protein FlgC
MTIKTHEEYKKFLQNLEYKEYEVTLADGTKQIRKICVCTPEQLAMHLRNTSPTMVSFKEIEEEFENFDDEYEPRDPELNPAGSYYPEGFTNSELY